MSGAWKTIALSEIAGVFNGKTPSKAEQRPEGHPVLKIRDVSEIGEYRGKFESFVDHDLAEKYAAKRVRKGDTLILNAAHNAEYVASKTYRAQPPTFDALATGEWLIIRPSEKLLDGGFVHYWVTSKQIRRQLRELVNGIHLYPKDVARLQIPLPPLAEQKRIAAILDAADALRAKRREALAQLDALLQSTFLTLFGDPVSNPMGWPTASFDDCLQDLTSSAIKIPKSDFQLGGQWQIIDQSQNEIAGYSDIGPPFTQALPAVVFGDHTRCVKLVRQPFLLGADGAKLLVPRKQMLSVFLSYLLPLLKLPDLGYSRHMREVKRLVYPLPPLPLQQKFAAIVESIERQKTTQRAHLADLDALFAALQHRAFRGEL